MKLDGWRGVVVLCTGLAALAICAWRDVPGAAVALAGAATSIIAYVTRPIGGAATEPASHDEAPR